MTICLPTLHKEVEVQYKHKIPILTALRVSDKDNGGGVPNVSLPDEDTGVMNALRQSTLEDLGLEPPLHEILKLQGQHVIETHAALIQHTDADETTDEGITLEETLRVLVIKLQKLTSGTTNFGKDKGDTPDLALVAEAILAGELQRVHMSDKAWS